MSEINRNNFKEKLPKIKKSLEKCKFVSIDLEFSALQPLLNQSPRLFDSNKERYAKLRLNLLKVIPVQVGITAYQFENDTNDYFGEVFTFYTIPSAFGNSDRSFYFQASTTNFLCLHNFDFNKFAYAGIPYLNNEEEAELRYHLKSDNLVGENCHMRSEFDDAVKLYTPLVNKWYHNCKVGDFLEIPEIVKKYENFYEIIFFIHKHLRNKFKNLWTYENNNCFCLRKVDDEELETLQKNCTLNEDLINELIGFRHVFNILISQKKPLVGHNLLQDLMILINNFYATLPESYSHFKQITNQLFPSIFDTKTVYYELRSKIPKEKLPEDTSLKALFSYFKDGVGRHLLVDRSAIDCNIEKSKFGNYHDAGWDSFCAGYIFLRMGYYNISLSGQYPQSMKFVTGQIISALAQYRNCVNVIRGAAAHIRIDGQDPSSNRPPWLIVESLKNEPVNMSDLMSLLNCYGCVDVRKLSPKGNRVLVAVDTYKAAREISKTFQSNPKFQVKQYNVLRHSPVAKVFLLSAVTISGTLLLLLTHTMINKR